MTAITRMKSASTRDGRRASLLEKALDAVVNFLGWNGLYLAGTDFIAAAFRLLAPLLIEIRFLQAGKQALSEINAVLWWQEHHAFSEIFQGRSHVPSLSAAGDGVEVTPAAALGCPFCRRFYHGHPPRLRLVNRSRRSETLLRVA